MTLEIERKFLVQGDDWKKLFDSFSVINQYYFLYRNDLSIRVRIQNDHAVLTIKQSMNLTTRKEYDFPMQLEDAIRLQDSCLHPIKKKRYSIEYRGKTWIIDEYLEANAGLVIAEIELEYENEKVEYPVWLGKEVTLEPRYLNTSLYQFPYKYWNT